MLLVNGASGGVGTAAVQIGRLAGARVLASPRSEEARRRLAELGAETMAPDDVDYMAQPGKFGKALLEF